jgi:hypothetical protein
VDAADLVGLALERFHFDQRGRPLRGFVAIVHDAPYEVRWGCDLDGHRDIGIRNSVSIPRATACL